MSALVVRGWVAPFFSPGSNIERAQRGSISLCSHGVEQVRAARHRGERGHPGAVGSIMGRERHQQLALGVKVLQSKKAS